VQAEIAACHARAHSVQATEWERVAALYVVLGHLTPSPVIELNRAVAVAMAYGPAPRRRLHIRAREAGCGGPGIPLTGLVLLGLVADQLGT
jgi:hypothetical protein